MSRDHDATPHSDIDATLHSDAARRAAWTLAAHAEDLARAMEAGSLDRRNGVQALRLFAAVVRASDAPAPPPDAIIGHA